MYLKLNVYDQHRFLNLLNSSFKQRYYCLFFCVFLPNLNKNLNMKYLNSSTDMISKKLL